MDSDEYMFVFPDFLLLAGSNFCLLNLIELQNFHIYIFQPGYLNESIIVYKILDFHPDKQI